MAQSGPTDLPSKDDDKKKRLFSSNFNSKLKEIQQKIRLIPFRDSSASAPAIRGLSTLQGQGNFPFSSNTQTKGETTSPQYLVETNSLQQIRKRTFSHWPHQTVPSTAQMIEAGFFNCNIGDRVICIYCNLICQQWTPHTDDPYEVHKTLSPQCPYVKAKQNKISPKQVDSQDLASTAFHPDYIEPERRYASFNTWRHENLPSIDDFVRAGFFYSGTGADVTCFYCNSTLQNWKPGDNLIGEHVRWFSYCEFARKLFREECQRIRQSKQTQQEHVGRAEVQEDASVRNTNNINSPVIDNDALEQLVAVCLDLPVSQRLSQNFKQPIIKRAWKDQLRLKGDHFASDSDLYMACLILQKQVEHINGKRENIVVPSIKMKQIREQNGASSTEQGVISQTEIPTSSANDANISENAAPSNPCVLCLTEEKRLACIPCGHLATCVACGHSLRSCPICKREIETFVRVYI